MTVRIEKVARYILSILINRPEKRNALNIATVKALKNALDLFEADSDLKVAIIGGVGGNFSAGLDLSEVVHPESGLADMRNVEQMLFPLRTRLTENKITIAAIEGHAAGVGYELALKCDFRVADRDSRMGFMNRRFGIPIFNGGTVILPRLICQARASDLIATGRAQLANEALQFGVITSLADIGCSLGRSVNLARSLAKFDQAALLLDLKPSLPADLKRREIDLLRQERDRGLKHLIECGPLEVAMRFLSGKQCRHGNYSMANEVQNDVEVTL